MVTNLLEKDVVIYKQQFERLSLEIYHSHLMERLSIDLDSLLFRIKYMVKHKKDLSSLKDLKKEFIDKSLQLREVFGNLMKAVLLQIPMENFSENDILDIFAQDVRMDGVYIKFKMLLFSDNEEYLKYVDSYIPKEVFNIFPHEYFRFYTDSYNDGIAKAYPELFEKTTQDKIGTGADQDVFCHSFTFQVTEACSLNCTYCLLEGTKITLLDGSEKNIEDLQVGEEILGFDEHNPYQLKPAKITHTFHRKAENIYRIITDNSSLCITGNHKIVTDNGWMAVEDLTTGYHPGILDKDQRPMFSHSMDVFQDTISGDVYNLETETGTYIANNILVHNCYQANKTKERMSFETGKKFIDNLLADKYDYINRYNSPAIILEFIGGEPLLEVVLIRKLYEYFLDQCYELNHPWFSLHRLSICSNGLQYFDPEVQDFFKNYASNISFNISIDGNKKLHDSCRIQPNGEGSYDIDIKALNHYASHYIPDRNSKMTLAPSNIKYLFESVKSFIDQGMKVINLNCIFEEGWKPKHALIEYEQLKLLSNHILENDLENIYLSIFNERQESVGNPLNDSNSCGGNGKMLSLRPNGQFYPCIRFMPTSVGNDVEDLCIGHIDKGLDSRNSKSKVLEKLDEITRRTQLTDICFECPIGNQCPGCTALSHTVFGTPNKKATFSCIMQIAQFLSNVYYWNNLLLKHPDWNLDVRKNVLPDEWSLLVINKDELDYLKTLECMAMIIKMQSHEKNRGE